MAGLLSTQEKKAPSILRDDILNLSLYSHFGLYRQKRFTVEQILNELAICTEVYRRYWLDLLVLEVQAKKEVQCEWSESLFKVIKEGNASQLRKLLRFFNIIISQKKISFDSGIKRGMTFICSVDCKNEEVLSHYFSILESIIELSGEKFDCLQDKILKFVFQNLDLRSSSTQDAIASCFSKLPLMSTEENREKKWKEYMECIMFFLNELIDLLLNIDRDNFNGAVMFGIELPHEHEKEQWTNAKLLRLITCLTKCGIMFLKNPQGDYDGNILEDYYMKNAKKIFDEFTKQMNRKSRLQVPYEILATVFCNISSLAETFIRHFGQNFSMFNTARFSIDKLDLLEGIHFKDGVFYSFFRKSIFGILDGIFQQCSSPVAVRLLATTHLLIWLRSSFEIVDNPKTEFLKETKEMETMFSLNILLQFFKKANNNTMDDFVRIRKVICWVERAVITSQVRYAQSMSFPVPYERKECRKLLYECLFAVISKIELSPAKLERFHRALDSGRKDPDTRIKNLCEVFLLKFRHPSYPRFKLSRPNIFTVESDEDLKEPEKQEAIMDQGTFFEHPDENICNADAEIQNLSVNGINTVNGRYAVTPPRIDRNFANAPVEMMHDDDDLHQNAELVELQNVEMHEVESTEMEESDENEAIDESEEGELPDDEGSVVIGSENDDDGMDEEDSDEYSDEEAEHSDDMSDFVKKVKFNYVPLDDEE